MDHETTSGQDTQETKLTSDEERKGQEETKVQEETKAQEETAESAGSPAPPPAASPLSPLAGEADSTGPPSAQAARGAAQGASGDEATQAAKPPHEHKQIAVRQIAAQLGLDVSAWPDDATALKEILQGYAQYHRSLALAQQAQRYTQHADQFEAWLAQQAQAQQNQTIKTNLLKAGAARTANHAGSLAAQANPLAPSQNPSASLASQLLAAFQEAGITDADFRGA